MPKNLLMRSHLISLLASLALVACGGGNDVASSGATAVSAAAPTPASVSPAVTSTSTTTTEPKVNGQVDERTGVAPVAAQATLCMGPACPSPPNPWTVYYGVCAKSTTFGGMDRPLTPAQTSACITEVAKATVAQTVEACEASASYGGTGPRFTDPIIQHCWDALPGYAWGSPWVVTFYGGCARSSSFGGSEQALTLAQKDACITALNNAENLEQCFSLGGKSWTVGKGSGGCDVGLVVKTETVTVTDNSNGGCGKSSTFGGNEPALTLAQQIACQKAFGNALTFQQCFSLGGIWATLAKVVIDGAGHERTGVCGFKKCSPNEQTGLCK